MLLTSTVSCNLSQSPVSLFYLKIRKGNNEGNKQTKNPQTLGVVQVLFSLIVIPVKIPGFSVGQIRDFTQFSLLATEPSTASRDLHCRSRCDFLD